jgi:hypothetical protein
MTRTSSGASLFRFVERTRALGDATNLETLVGEILEAAATKGKA